MITISSSKNQQVKLVSQLNVKSKVRKEHGLFVVEGKKMFQEAPMEYIQKVYVSESFFQENQGDQKLMDCEYEVVADHVFDGMTDTKTPQGILCLVEQFGYNLKQVLDARDQRPFLMLLEDLQDPGNVGTIFRTAEGAGVTGIILSKNSVDIYNPKTIRSTMGSIYRMPFVYVDDLLEILPELQKAQITTYGAHLSGSCYYDEAVYEAGTAFFIGNEGNGLSDALSSKAQVLIKIPMLGQLESLNAAMASGILMYEVNRQRRGKKPL